MTNHCETCHTNVNGATCDTQVAGWWKVLDNAKMYGTKDDSYNPLVSGTFTKFKAVYRDGCVGCSTSHPFDPANKMWQCCGASYTSFELYKNDKQWIAQQSSWNSLPSGCSRQPGQTGDIVCDVSSVTVNAWDTLTPTWKEPSTPQSTGDNHGTLYLDLWAYGTVDNSYVKLLDNAKYYGTKNGDQVAPLATGTFSKVVAVWRSGCVGCSTSSHTQGWQCCANSHGGAAGFAVSWELMKNGALLPGMESSSWNNVPSACTAPSSVTAPIKCNVAFTVAPGDKLSATWREPRLATSTSDNHGTGYFDLYGLAA